MALIAFLLKRGHLDLNSFRQLADPFTISIGLALAGASILIQAWRWQKLLLSRCFPMSVAEAIKLFLIGVFFNYALPGSIGGDVVKAYYVAQDNKSKRIEAVLSVVFDRLIGLYVMICFALVTLGFHSQMINQNPQFFTLSLSSLALWAAMTLFFAAAFSSRVKDWFRFEYWLSRMPLGEKWLRLYHGAQAYGQSRHGLYWAVALSVVSQFLSIFFMMFIGYRLGETSVPVDAYFFAVPLGFIISSVPIAPAGLGVGQIAFLVLFQMYTGQSSQLGQTAITAFQLAVLVWGFFGAFFYLRRKHPASFAETASW